MLAVVVIFFIFSLWELLVSLFCFRHFLLNNIILFSVRSSISSFWNTSLFLGRVYFFQARPLRTCLSVVSFLLSLAIWRWLVLDWLGSDY